LLLHFEVSAAVFIIDFKNLSIVGWQKGQEMVLPIFLVALLT
jgi:hypothetical protein